MLTRSSALVIEAFRCGRGWRGFREAARLSLGLDQQVCCTYFRISHATNGYIVSATFHLCEAVDAYLREYCRPISVAFLLPA